MNPTAEVLKQKTFEGISPEQVRSVGEDMASVLQEKGFETDLISEFKEIVDTQDVSFEPDKAESHFYDVGMIREGMPNGQYLTEIGGQSVKNRTDRLRGHVPEGSERELGETWMIAHELGHALQAAYGLHNKHIRTEGVWRGLARHPSLPEDFLKSNPDEAMDDDKTAAMRIESERQAEGLANMFLVDELMARGLSKEHALETINRASEPLRQKARQEPTPHNIGYANPLSEREVIERFSTRR